MSAAPLNRDSLDPLDDKVLQVLLEPKYVKKLRFSMEVIVYLTQGEKGVRGGMGERGDPGEEVSITSLHLSSL